MCAGNAKVLAQKAATVVPKGGLLIGVLVEGDSLKDVATRQHLDAWVKSVGAPHTWTLDAAPPQPRLKHYFDRQRDTFVLFELSTMRIVDILEGSAPDAVARLEALLAQ